MNRIDAYLYFIIQLIVSCAAEADNPEVSNDYHVLRRIIDIEEQFIEVKDLGEELAMQVIRLVKKYMLSVTIHEKG